MRPPPAGTPDLARHLDDQMRAQERQLVGVRLAVVVLGTGFLAVFGEPIEGRPALIGLLAGVAAYGLMILLLLRRLPVRPVAVFGVSLDVLAVSGVVWLATNVPDSYLFYSLVILGTAIRFGMVPSIASAVVISAIYLAIVLASDGAGAVADVQAVVPVRMLYLVIFGVVAGLFSRIIITRAAENARLQQRLEAEQDHVAREQQAQRIKDDFLSVVSHELRTPLTSIQGYSQLLESRLGREGSGSKEMAHVRVILSQVMRMRRLVDDLLDVNRMDRRGGVGVEPVDFDLAELLREAVNRVARAEPERDIALTAPAAIPVHLDRDRIDQVMSNLLENAVKYSPDGGPIRVMAAEHADEIEVSVADSGIGIQSKDREHVFERFYQADDEHGRRRFGGLGLGLAISRGIVEAHGGLIRVGRNRKVRRGSVFTFRVPRRAVPTVRPAIGDDEVPEFVRRIGS